jgi:hypothetical protein
MRQRRAELTLVLGALAGVWAPLAQMGCGDPDPPVYIPERWLADYVSTLCAPSFDCRGAAREFAGFGSDECHAMVEAWVSDARAHAGDVIYSQSCAEALYTRMVDFSFQEEASSTDAATALGWISCEEECQIYYGTAAIGEPCERFGRRMSTCAAELMCAFDGRCYDPCDQPLVIPLGGTCSYASGVLHAKCDAGLVCDPVSGVCATPPSPGVMCDPDAPNCSPSEGCSHHTETCEPRGPLGSQCDYHEDCESAVCREVCESEDPYQCDHPWF